MIFSAQIVIRKKQYERTKSMQISRKDTILDTINKKTDLVPALKEMINYPGPYVLDVQVPYQEHVLPMIPAGMTVREIIKE